MGREGLLQTTLCTEAMKGYNTSAHTSLRMSKPRVLSLVLPRPPGGCRSQRCPQKLLHPPPGRCRSQGCPLKLPRPPGLCRSQRCPPRFHRPPGRCRSQAYPPKCSTPWSMSKSGVPPQVLHPLVDAAATGASCESNIFPS